ncbi:hypothetical protein EMIT0P201_30083 [Pseudomonas chlororaphis]
MRPRRRHRGQELGVPPAPTEAKAKKMQHNPTTEIVHGPCFPSQLAVGRARR